MVNFEKEELEKQKALELEEAYLHYQVVCNRIRRKYQNWIDSKKEKAKKNYF